MRSLVEEISNYYDFLLGFQDFLIYLEKYFWSLF